jgi:peptidoglycan/LPS O-acetylase OafA/YrhL
VISGFLITSLIQRDIESGSFSFASFWERRIRRILPALLAVVTSTLVAGWLLLMPDAYESLAESAVGLSLLVSNVQFWQNTGYFAKSAEETPLLHTWSLAVEEQFYLVVPILLVLLARFTTAGWRLKILVTIAVMSFSLSVYGTLHHPSATFYLLPTRAWELLAGGILALLRRSDRSRASKLDEAFALVGILLILVPCFAYSEHTMFPGLSALPPVMGSVLLIWSGTNAERLSLVARILAMRPVVFVGLISYSLYLWHWPIFAFARYFHRGPLPVAQTIPIVVGSFCLGILSWRFIELPFRNGNIIKSRRRAASFAGASFIVLLGLGTLIANHNGSDGRVSAQTRLFVETSQRDDKWTCELDVNDVPDNLATLGTGEARPRILVWGDSHAMAVLPAIDSLCREKHIDAVAATHSSTLPLRGYFQSTGDGLKERAIPFNDAVIEYVRTRQIDVVLLVACRWNRHFKDSECLAATLDTARILQKEGAAVYLMNTVPTFSYDVGKFVALYHHSGRLAELKLSLDDYMAGKALDQRVLFELRKGDVRVLEPATVFFKSGREFRPYDLRGSYYRDGGHLSTHGALALKPLFEPLFESLESEDSYSTPRIAAGLSGPRE